MGSPGIADLSELLVDPAVHRGFARLLGIARSMGTIPTQPSSPTTALGVGSAVVLPTLQPVLPVPISARDIVLAGIAAREIGKIDPEVNRLPLAVSAGATVSFTNAPPNPYVWVLVTPLFATVNFHGSLITVAATVDGQDVVLDYPMYRDDVLPIAQYSVVGNSLSLTVSSTAHRAGLFMSEVQFAQVDQTTYESRIKGIVENGNLLMDAYAQFAKLARTAGGG